MKKIITEFSGEINVLTTEMPDGAGEKIRTGI